MLGVTRYDNKALRAGFERAVANKILRRIGKTRYQWLRDRDRAPARQRGGTRAARPPAQPVRGRYTRVRAGFGFVEPLGRSGQGFTRDVLVPQAGVSIIGAIMLGLGRALGETMAVTFVIGNANRLSASIFDPGSTIASRIANEFNEAIGLQLNALIALGCILFLVTFAVLIVARVLVSRMTVH